MQKKELIHFYDIKDFNLNDLDVLLHKILKQTRTIINAQAGTIYIKEKDFLKFQVLQNDALSYEDIYTLHHTNKQLKLSLKEKGRYLAVDSFLDEKIILVDNIYESESYDFLGVKEFDVRFKYRTKSIITVPLVNNSDNKVIGVVQLLNKKLDNKFVSFSSDDKELLSMFSSYISLSISQAQSSVEQLRVLNSQLKDANEKLEKKIEKEQKENNEKSAIIFHQSKMASMGELIGNIAHQWRQPLNKISTISSGLKLNIELEQLDENFAKEQLSAMVDTSKLLSSTIDEFRAFYNIENIKETFNLSLSINKALDIAQTVMQNNKIEIITVFDKKLEIYGLKNEFTQALINLLINAKDALLEKTSLKEKRYIFINLYKKEEKILIEIKDNAFGISNEIKDSIFDKDFSTRTDFISTGMGLYLTRFIIEKHLKGKVSFENIEYSYDKQKYKGALFTIELLC